MLTNKRQARKLRETASPTTDSALSRRHSGSDGKTENVAIFPLAILMLAGPTAIMSVMVVSVVSAEAL